MPEWKQEIRRRLSGSKLEPAREAEIVEELSQHMEDRYAESMAGAATPEEAYRATLAELRDSESLESELRQIESRVSQEPVVLGANRSINMLGGLWQDLRYGARMLAKAPGFTLLAVITLSLGIGANTAIFSGVNAMLFRPPPGTREPERLYHINPGNEDGRIAYAYYADLLARSHAFEGIAVHHNREGRNVMWRFDGQRQTLSGELVSGNYFQTLGAAAVLGRALTPEDDAAGAENVVVLSDATWRKYFAADPNVIGKQVIIGKQGFTVVGVMAPEFQGAELWHPPAWWIAFGKGRTLNSSNRSGAVNEAEWERVSVDLIGRLKPGISPRQAQAELDVIFAGIKQLKPEAWKVLFVSVEPARGFKRASDFDRLYPLIAITVAVVGLTLLIACANVASFLLARATSRRKEIGVRLALGASRFRLIRQLLTESTLLALLGGAAALLLSLWATDLLSYAVSLTIQQDSRQNFSPDWKVFGAALLISLLVGIICGLAPALQSSKVDLTAALKDETGIISYGLRRLSWRNALIVAQVAGSLVLLTGSGLFLRSAQQALKFDLGFEMRHLSLSQISIDRKRYSDAQAEQFFRELRSRVAALPEAQSVALAEGPLLDGGRNNGRHKLKLADADQAPFGDRQLESFFVSPQFFATAGIPLTSGRDFTERDHLDAGRVVIINEALARRAFPGQNPVGRQLRLIPDYVQPNGAPVEIIGVVKDASHHNPGEGAEPYLYRPIGQFSGYRGAYLVLFVRAQRDSASVLASVANIIISLDPETSFSQSTIADNLHKIALPSKIASAFFGLFGALGLLLAAVGLSGALAYAVARRAKEIGIRMALGADRASVLRMIILEGLALTLAGVVIGALLALALTRALASYLYGVSPSDPLTYLATTLILTVVALLASYFPARRAAGVDPMTALRHD
jgi:predicted permease